MKRSSTLVGWLAPLLIAVPVAAMAQDAYTSRTVNVRAGPDSTYPVVAQLGTGAPLRVMGCLSDWSWCDVVFGDNRGWAYGPYLSYAYQGGRVPFYSYAPSFGVPIVTFSLGSYWDNYYRGRPFYGRRDYWVGRPPPPHVRPPGPPPRPTPPPPPRPQPHAGPGGSPGGPPQGGNRPPQGGTRPQPDRPNSGPPPREKSTGGPPPNTSRPPPQQHPGGAPAPGMTRPSPNNAGGGHPGGPPKEGGNEGGKPPSRGGEGEKNKPQ